MSTDLQIAIESSFLLQDAANKVMAGPDWKEQGLDWTTCALAELGEFFGWTAYKHWKKSDDYQPNWHQAFIEIVDSYHFMLSAAIEYDVTPGKALKQALESVSITNEREALEAFTNATTVGEKKSLAKNAVKSLMAYCLDAEDNPSKLSKVVSEHLAAAAAVGFSRDEFFAAYVPKNTLNLFRQFNGDRQGTYPRMWEFEGQTIEDNQVVEILTKRNPELALDSIGLATELGKILSSFAPAKTSKPGGPSV